MKIEPSIVYAALAMVIAQSCLAVLPATLPEFKSQGELAELHRIASNQAQSEAFFTGKPYEETGDGYLFKYRNYNPEISRWTSCDPSGFPDGANHSIYSCTTAQVDPNGQYVVNVNGTPKNGAGSTSSNFYITTIQGPQADPGNRTASMEIQFNSSLSGFVVQHIQISYELYNPFGSPYTIPNFGPLEYWEVWSFGVFGMEAGGIDTYRTPNIPVDVHGTLTITGKVDFYQTPDQNQWPGADDPANWGSLQIAGGLRATTTQPIWWMGTGYDHNMTVDYE